MKYIFCVLLTFFLFTQSIAQTTFPIDKKKHAVSGELGGLGLMIGINYDHLIHLNDFSHMDGRIGMSGYFFIIGLGLGFPHSITYNIGGEYNFLEVGVGGTAVTLTTVFDPDESVGGYLFAPAILGYKRVSESGFLLRVYSNLYLTDGEVMPWFGIGLGKSW